MASKTPLLGLILPALGEYFGRWDRPVNENFKKVDEVVGTLQEEVTSARGGSASLNDRLSESLNADGSLKDVPEVAAARSSKVYGSGTGGNFFTLDDRLEEGDAEVALSRQGLSALRDILAWAKDDVMHNCLVSGPVNPLTYSGAIVTLNGGTTPIVSNINGYRCVTSVNEQITISGSAGTYHIYQDRNPTGKLLYTTPTTSGSTGLITSTNKLSKYKATGTNLVTSGVKVGHVLEITDPGGNLNLGRWTVLETAVENPSDLGTDEVRIVGEFASSSTGLSATFYDLNAPTLGFTGTAPSKLWSRVSNRIYIGRVVFDGTNVTSIIGYAYQARFATWQSVSLTGGDYDYTINHYLGFIPKSIQLYASQANDFSQPLEPLAVSEMDQGSVSLSTGDQSSTYTAPKLRRSCIVRFTDTTLEVKNATNGIFYEDYDNNAQTTGYMYVVVER